MGDKDANDLSKSEVPGIRATQLSNTGMALALLAYNIPYDGPYSPLSITAILATLKAGVGVGFKQQFNPLRVEVNDSEFFKGFSTTLKSVHSKSNEPNFTLKIENRVFAKNSLKLKQDFVDLLNENFRTKVTSVDFSKSNEVVHAVNTWATSSTNNLMGTILPPEITIGEELDLVWFSMVYFKGFWAQKFNPNDSFNGPFFIDGNESVQVRYMQMTNHKFLVGKKDFKDMKVDIISIPYQGNRLRLVVYLPNAGSELSDVIMKERDASIFLPHLLADMLEEKNVNLIFPKFKRELYWPPLLPLLFMGLPFDQQIDWSSIGHHEDGRVINKLNAFEKIVVEFDEGVGGGAGDSTGDKRGVKRKADETVVSAEIVDFNVNRPFFYSIWDTFTNMMIIQGHCKNPRPMT